MRLIDADALKEKLCILGEHRIERLVEKEPTVDVLEQIRDEISAILTNSYDEGVKEKALQIIDKYK